MRKEQFKIGNKFFTLAGIWRCTDIGTRTIAAIQIHDFSQPKQKDESCFIGPPYAVEEYVFDENDFGGCAEEEPKSQILS
jgi:hypothetical protein